MSLISLIWPMIAAVSLTLAAVHLLVWLKDRSAAANGIFAIVAVSASAVAWFELALIRAETPEQYEFFHRWGHLAAGIYVIGFVSYVWAFLGSGRKWLGWTIIGIRSFMLVLNFLPTRVSFTWESIQELKPTLFLGEMIGLPIGTYARWTMLDDLSTVLILVFVIDATLSVLLRREASTADRKRALVVGAGIISCVIIAGGSGILMHSFSVPVTYLISVGFMAVVLPVGYELSNDLIKASRLTGELKESLLHLARLQQEVAHFSRVSLMGELSASLAHELNQPLTAIMANAQAAQRFIANDRVDLDEFREILRDIVCDTARARDVIRNVRILVKKGEREMSPLNVNEVATQVIQFLHGDIVGRNITLKQDFAKDLPFVTGDRTQIQQVLINLLLNAFEAVGTNAVPRRRVTLVTAEESGTVHVRVQDTGSGIRPEHLEHLFQPFFTTKASGMGMGLTVSRSIVEAHGGRLWAENLPDGGARLSLTLPAASGNCEESA